MSDKMREAFEKWALSNDGPSVSVTRNDVGRYEDEELNIAWLGWQAAQSYCPSPDPVKLAELGWQMIECPICGGGAQAFPQQAAQSAAVPVVGEVDCYDAGLLSDFGGGNVEWWQDYIRAELARAHEFYASQMPTTSITAAELDALRKDAERLQKDAERMQKALLDIAEWTDRYTKPGHPISNVARAAIAGEKKDKENA